MRTCCWGLAGLGLLAIASPAFAEVASFTLDGHQFNFDIPPGFIETKSPESDIKIKTFEINQDSQLIALIEFSVKYETVEEEFDKVKNKSEVKSVYLPNGRIGYFIDTFKGQVGAVFASACSGKCIIHIAIANYDASGVEALLQQYARALASGNFGGQ